MIDYTFPMLVGGSEVPTERQLTSKVEAGTMMNGVDSVRYIVIHCSATRADRDYTPEQMLRDHKARGFRTIGYHAYIRKDGTVTYHRHWLEVGAHARPFNRCSIGICYEGGIAVADSVMRNAECGMTPQHSTINTPHYCDTRTPAQMEQLLLLLMKLKKMFPKAKIVGHRDLPGVHKECPCFDVEEAYGFLNE